MTLIKKQLCSCGAGNDAVSKLEDSMGNMYFLCGDSKCKQEFLEELAEHEFRATHQGRKRSSYNSSMDAVIYCFYVGIVFVVGYLIYWLFK